MQIDIVSNHQLLLTFSKKRSIMHNVELKARSVKLWQLFLPAFFRRPLFFLHANIIWNNIHNPQKYLRFSVTDGIIYLGKHPKYNLLHSIPPYPAGCGTQKTDGGPCNDRLRQDGYFPRREPSESFCPFAAATGLFA